MPRIVHETTIPDMDGIQHRYETIPLQFDEALNLKLEIMRIVAKPFAGVLSSVGTEGLDANINMETLGAALSQLPAALIEAGGSSLFARLLHDTTRIGNNGDGKLFKQALRDPNVRTEAYSGGNWQEYYSAIAWVIKVNYGPFWTVLTQNTQKLSGLFLPKRSESIPPDLT